MENEKGILINKYGAVDVKVISDLIDSVDLLGKLVDSLIDVNSFWIKELPEEGRIIAFKQLAEDLKKIKELTKCDDYEYQTTPETKKLVKKEVKNDK